MPQTNETVLTEWQEGMEAAARIAEGFADDDCDPTDRFDYGYTTAARSIARAIRLAAKSPPIEQPYADMEDEK